jgi:zinc transporter ZupT
MAGGSFLYISASDLIPETHKEKGYKNAVFLLFGVIFLFVISKTLGA